MDKPEHVSQERLERYLRQAQDYWFHVYRPRPGHVVVDVGAGRGEDTYAFARAVGPGGRVWAIEAHPKTYELLVELRDAHGLGNVTPLQLACMEREGVMQIETLADWRANFVSSGAASAMSHTVQALPLDEICERHGIEHIDFLKMNIEGAERLALTRGSASKGHRASFS